MVPWTSYVGLFTGLIIIGMGVYLYVSPVANLPAWAAQGLPVFMLIYGIGRAGLSVYQLLRQRKASNHAAGLSLLLLGGLLTHCGSGSEPNLRVRLDYVGECATCPIQRIDSILHAFFAQGIFNVQYDSLQNQIIIELDSQRVRLDTLFRVLLAHGYEVGEQISDDPILSPCCIVPGLPDTTNLLVLGPSELQEGISLSERQLEVVAEDEPIDLDAELNLEEDLEQDIKLEEPNLDELIMDIPAVDEDLLSLEELVDTAFRKPPRPPLPKR
ncbi:MAG: hypothetical protein NZ958_07305 [Bacteroidia bacterium]|nr:hypothetical protein [Bacteroidia bacterium]MDW8088709.1 hypothetical protein [Bacteroidia bacterium]